MEGGREELCCSARNGGGSRQGKKVPEGRCGKTIEAKLLSGQTCLIEPAEGSAGNNEGKENGDGYPDAIRSQFKRLTGEAAPGAD